VHGKGGLDRVGGVVRTTLRPELQDAARAGLQAALRAVDARHKIGRPVRKVKADKVNDELAKLGKKLPKGGPAKGEVYEAIVTAVHDGDPSSRSISAAGAR
jgi:membrane carboxypeptidase/penicillin-binding protein